MNIRNAALTFGLFLALAIPATAFSDTASNAPLVVAKDEAKCEVCMKKLTALCDSENKLCASKDGAAACLAFYEKCKASVAGRCGGPSLCD
ncbi:MAG: hypothetical protein ACKN9T_12455 [Candidatus Methylumidiphilus sp.]